MIIQYCHSNNNYCCTGLKYFTWNYYKQLLWIIYIWSFKLFWVRWSRFQLCLSWVVLHVKCNKDCLNITTTWRTFGRILMAICRIKFTCKILVEGLPSERTVQLKNWLIAFIGTVDPFEFNLEIQASIYLHLSQVKFEGSEVKSLMSWLENYSKHMFLLLTWIKYCKCCALIFISWVVLVNRCNHLQVCLSNIGFHSHSTKALFCGKMKPQHFVSFCSELSFHFGSFTL